MGSRRVLITLEILQEIITLGWSGDGLRVRSGVPVGADLIGAHLQDQFVLDPAGERPAPLLALTFEHPSWDGPDPGAEIPVLMVEIQRITPPRLEIPAPPYLTHLRRLSADDLRQLLLDAEWDPHPADGDPSESA